MAEGPSVTEREMREQPEALARLLDTGIPQIEELGAALAEASVTRVLIAARGSSDNAARYAQYLFGIQHGIPVTLATPSLVTVYGRDLRLRNTLVIGVSQSGEAPDVTAVLESARQQGQPTLAITNHPASPLADAADRTLDLRAGEELAVAATKTYTASLVALALVSAALGEPGGRRQRIDALRALPETVERTVDRTLAVAPDVAGRLAPAQHCAVVGRGLNYSTAFEVALKIRELTGILAEAHSAPDLLHGPVAAIGEGFPVLLITPSEPSQASVRALLAPLRERGARVLAISDDEEILEAVDDGLPLAGRVAEWLTPVTAVLPGQALALHLALARGLDPDQPAGLHKVTETH